MADNLIPPKSTNNEGLQNAAGEHSCHEGGCDPIKEVTTPEGNNSANLNSIWILLGALDAGGILLFWGYSEFFGSHNSPILSNICFFGFSASVLAALAGFTFKHWPHAVIICFIYILLCGVSGMVIYEYSKPLPAKPAGSKPVVVKSAMNEPATNTSTAPPKLPRLDVITSEVITISFGKIEKQFRRSDLEASPQTVISVSEQPVILASIKNGRLSIDADILGGKSGVLKLRDNKIPDLPLHWDSNHSADGSLAEIVNEFWMPVFQIKYISPSDVEIRGLFFGFPGIFAAGDDGTHLVDLKSRGVGAFDSVKAPMRRLFKYPSKTFPGVLNDGDNAHVFEVARPTIAVISKIGDNATTECAEYIAQVLTDVGITAFQLGMEQDEPFPKEISISIVKNETNTIKAAEIKQALSHVGIKCVDAPDRNENPDIKIMVGISK